MPFDQNIRHHLHGRSDSFFDRHSRGRDRGVDDDCDGEYTRRFLTRLRRPETILRPGRWTGLAMFAMTMGRFAITSKAPCATASCPIFRASRSPGQTAKQLSGANPPGGYSATHIAGAALPKIGRA